MLNGFGDFGSENFLGGFEGSERERERERKRERASELEAHIQTKTHT